MALTLAKLRRWLPADWASGIPAGGVWGMGYDVATSDKKTSNPSALVVRQQVGSRAIEWLVTSWKTEEPADSLLIITTVAADLCAAGLKPRRMVVDNSNERYHAKDVKDALRPMGIGVLGVGGNTVLTYGGETYTAKHLLGTLYVRDYDDGHLWIPRAEGLKQDRSLVQYFGGSFSADVDAKGRHADTFDAGKNAKWACIGKRGGSGEASTPEDTAATSPGRRDVRAKALHSSVRRRGAQNAL